ncbi:MAG: lysine--tRNA ligase [bacterium]|nr:lysine--tRNA ligase [bacterium]
MKALEELRQVRLAKAEKFRKMGIDPYPSQACRTHTAGEIASDFTKLEGQPATVAGRIMSQRGYGKIAFWDLVDESGKIQLYLKEGDLNPTTMAHLDLFDIGDFVQASGAVTKTQTGEISILVKDLHILTKSIRPLPEKWAGLKDPELRLRKRYLDLIVNPEAKELFRLKAKWFHAMRTFLEDHGFLEVHTPSLQTLSGGADARPFVTHMNALDIDLYLRIAPELYLKRLIVGGYEKVYEVGRNFRNEGIDAEHLQDYEACEFYWAYADFEDLKKFLVEWYRYMVKETIGSYQHQHQGQLIDWSREWEELDYLETVKKLAGVDLRQEDSVADLRQVLEAKKISYEKEAGWGRLADLVWKKICRPQIIQPAFLVNHPVEISPLSKRNPADPKKVLRLNIVAGGWELANAFCELNDPLDQYERFAAQEKLKAAGDEEAQNMDLDFVEALEYGMPPTVGLGLSERLFSFFVDKPLRETTLFPLMR